MKRSNLPQIVYWILLGLALLGLATQLLPLNLNFLTTQARAIAHPYSIDYGEGPILDQTLRLANFENIYRNTFDVPPYTISNYPPLYLLVQVHFAWMFGPAFWYGRLINLICVLLTGLFITLTLRALTRDWIGAVVGGLLLTGFPYIQFWAKFNRIDELALVFSWAALYACVRLASRPNPPYDRPDLKQSARAVLASRGFWAAVLLFLAAIYTRQTYALAAPLAAFFWLVFGARGRWQNRLLAGLLLGACVGGLTLALFLILNLASAGGFYLNIVVANVNAFYWNTVWNNAEQVGGRYWPLILSGLLFLLIELVTWLVRKFRRPQAAAQPEQAARPNYSAWALVLPYLLAAFAGAITIGKDGSSVNYLLEVSAALSLAGGALLAWAWRVRRWWLRALLQVLFIGLLAYQAHGMIRWAWNDSTNYMTDREKHQADVTAALQILKDANGPVLADEYMGLVPLAGKRLYFQPFEYKQMADAKVWDETPFLDEIASHKFPVILWYQPAGWPAIAARYTRAQRMTVERYYQIDKIMGELYVFKPKP